MKTLVTFAAALGLSLTTLVVPQAFAEKPLPPAFGKELVPDSQSQSNPAKAAELDELRDEKEDEEVVRSNHRRPARSGKRVHIQLDGDEDGGGDDPDAGDW